MSKIDDGQLASLRGEIDELNFQILDLLNRRASVAVKIGRRKAELGVPGFDPVRESSMLERLAEVNQGPFGSEAITSIFQTIFRRTLELQARQGRGALLVSRNTHPADTVFNAGKAEFGRGFCVIAGPCAVESREQTESIAAKLEELGVKAMRGGAFKPRTSPYDFQGLGLEGLKILSESARRHNLAVISEILDVRDIEPSLPYLDMIQIGARNMYNYPLLKEAGRTGKPVMLKRAFSATLEELMLSAEYIMREGCTNVLLCERGIRTYEKLVRSTLDISAVPILKKETHLPVAVDISHAAGRRDILIPLAKAVKAVGADSLMVEVHGCPACAKSDSRQQMDFKEFTELLAALGKPAADQAY